MLKRQRFNYLFDVTTVVPNHKLQILQEGVVDGTTNNPKVIFKAKLQTANEKNQNGRVYSRKVCESIASQLHDKAVSRSLLMEVDHPMVATKDPNVMKRRATTVE